MVNCCNRTSVNDFSYFAPHVLSKRFKGHVPGNGHDAGSMLLKTRLALALAFVFRSALRRRIAQGLYSPFLSFSIFLFLAKVHDGSAQRKTDGCADRQKNDV